MSSIHSIFNFKKKKVKVLIENVADLSASEEDGGFGVCGEKTRYATLQRLRQNPNQYPCDNLNNRGYQTMRNYRSSQGIPTIVSYF